MKTKIRALCALSLVGAAGCGQEGPPSTGGHDGGGNGVVQTIVEGRLYSALRGQKRRVEVVDLLDGVSGPVRCATESQRDGKWSCDLGPLYGDFVVQVDTGAGAPLRAVVDSVEQGKTKGVVVTPITHLTAAYLEARIAKDEPVDVALPNARRLMHGHFAAIAHHRVNPEDVSETLGSVLGEALVSGFLIVGLEALAADIAEANGQGAGGSIDVWRLVSALAADIRADGVFDGQGPQGQLRLGETALTGNTLRADYGRALLGWVDSEANTTVFVRSDFASLAERLANNTSEIFPEDVPDPLDDTPPMLLAVEVAADPAAPLPAGAPIAGDIFVTVEARDPSGLASFVLRHPTASIEPGEGEALGDTGRRWRLDGTALAEGAHGFELAVTDGAGNRAEQTVAVVVDNQAPVLIARAMGRSRSSTVAVTGEVTDSIGPVDTLTVTALGRDPVVLEAPEQFWSAVVELACDGQDHTVEVRAVDAAGNTAAELVEAGCDDSPPAIQVRPTSFLDGNQVDAFVSADGSTLDYAPVDFPAPTMITDTGPHAFTKYFTRLDHGSPELPVLSVTTGDDRGDDQVTVTYRYLVDGALVRGWTPIGRGNGFEWDVPVSYQSLGQELATAGTAALHRVEVRAADAAGNRGSVAFEFTMALRSPPVWLGQCEVHPTLRGFSLAQRNLHEVFTQRASTSVGAGQFRYLLGTNRQSLAPQGSLRVRLLGADVRAHIEAVRLDGHMKASIDRVPWANAQSVICAVGEHRLWSGAFGAGTDLGCRAGAFPRLGRAWRSRAADGPLNDDLPLFTGASLSSALGPVNIDGPHFVVEPELQYTLGTSILNPVLRVNGQPYTWPTQLDLPAGYTANGAPIRYRGFEAWRGWGADSLQQWLGGQNPGLDVRRFVTRPYVSEVSVQMSPVQLEVLHSDLDVTVPIQVDPACAQALTYRTSL